MLNCCCAASSWVNSRARTTATTPTAHSTQHFKERKFPWPPPLSLTITCWPWAQCTLPHSPQLTADGDDGDDDDYDDDNSSPFVIVCVLTSWKATRTALFIIIRLLFLIARCILLAVGCENRPLHSSTARTIIVYIVFVAVFFFFFTLELGALFKQEQISNWSSHILLPRRRRRRRRWLYCSRGRFQLKFLGCCFLVPGDIGIQVTNKTSQQQLLLLLPPLKLFQSLQSVRYAVPT